MNNRLLNSVRLVCVLFALINSSELQAQNSSSPNMGSRTLLVRDSLDFKIYNTKLNTGFNEFNGVLYQHGLVYESNQFVPTNRKKKFFLWNLLQSKRAKLIPEFAWDGSGFTQLFYYPNVDSLRSDDLVPTNWHEKKPLKNYT